jgi:hypothetical protein
MKLTTDDDIHRARLVYLGPKGCTFPIQLPYAQWGVGALVFVVLGAVAWFITGSLVSLSYALGATLPITYLIFRHVDPDRPARKVLGTVARDWRRTGPPAAGPEPRLTARKVRVTR